MSNYPRVEVDEVANCVYVELGHGTATRTVEIAEGVNVDYDWNGLVVGVEVLR